MPEINNVWCVLLVLLKCPNTFGHDFKRISSIVLLALPKSNVEFNLI